MSTLVLAAFLTLFGLLPHALPISAPQKSGAAIKTGPDPGTPLPPFQLKDQKGKKQDFESIRGPNGALIVFHRSADW